MLLKENSKQNDALTSHPTIMCSSSHHTCTIVISQPNNGLPQSTVISTSRFKREHFSTWL